MKKARIVIGANYGDEGKGTVVAHYTKHSEGTVLNVLTNGGAQRGHSILTEDGNITFHHFGSGTYHGADNFYSCFFILNPMQFVKEYDEMIVKPKKIYRDTRCRWSTPYDSMANMITETLQGRHASCGMGIWNTIKRCRTMITPLFDEFITAEFSGKISYLNLVKEYYEKQITIPDNFKSIWNSEMLKEHFINDCMFMANHTIPMNLNKLDYDNLIFENGQGLMLCDTGKDTYDTTPSNTGILYSLELMQNMKDIDVTAHYVTRPYLTRHGDGHIFSCANRENISKDVQEDRTNKYNEFQGKFRYGSLNISDLKNRIIKDSARSISFDTPINVELDITHCDEMDRESEFKSEFKSINTFDSPLIK